MQTKSAARAVVSGWNAIVTSGGRRGILTAFGISGAVLLARSARAPDSFEQATPQPLDRHARGEDGYRLTDHVKRYYETACV
jgi:hypothetical protein